MNNINEINLAMICREYTKAIEIWRCQKVEIKDYKNWRDTGIMLFAQIILLKQLGGSFSEVEIYARTLFGDKGYDILETLNDWR